MQGNEIPLDSYHFVRSFNLKVKPAKMKKLKWLHVNKNLNRFSRLTI